MKSLKTEIKEFEYRDELRCPKCKGKDYIAVYDGQNKMYCLDCDYEKTF